LVLAAGFKVFQLILLYYRGTSAPLRRMAQHNVI